MTCTGYATVPDGRDLDEVVGAELRLLDPGVRVSPEQVRASLHHDFREVGASGRVWDRTTVVQATAGHADDAPTAADVHAVHLAPDVVLVTYTANSRHGESLRSSVWVRVDGRWLLRHHQGTRALRA